VKIIGEVTDVTKKSFTGKDEVERESTTVWLEGLPLRIRGVVAPPLPGMHVCATVSSTWKKSAAGKSYADYVLVGWGEVPRL
jgi:hypothetical protein